MSKLLGIASLLSTACLLLVVILLFSANSNPPSVYIRGSLALFVLSYALVGCYLIRNYCPSTKAMTKFIIYLLGLVLALFGIAASFNLIDFLLTYNWLIAIGIIFTTLVELQLLNWGSKTGSIVKLSSIILLLSNLFLIVFFIAKWRYHELYLVINGTISASLLAFGIGIAFLPRRNKSTVDA